MALLQQTRLLGRSFTRIDGVERVTGRSRYAADWRFPGMLYAKVVLSDVPHARVKRIDASKALELPGVEAVLTHQDGMVRWHPGDRINSRYAITDKVRFAGDVVAAVAARSRQLATRATELIEVEYEELPAVFTVEEALKEDAPKIWDNGNIHLKLDFNLGDAEGALKECKRVFEATYKTARVHNSPMEPGASLAVWSGDQLTVYASSQAITLCKQALAQDLGLPQSKVRVITLFKGGGFGNKNRSMNYDIIAALLAKKTGKPVLLEYSRREDFINVHGRWGTKQELKVGVDEEGRIKAYLQRVYCDVGAYARHPTRYCEAALTYYDCHNIKSEIFAVYTNTPATGNMRAPEGVPAAFGAESFMDEVAYALGIDPLDFRLKNRAKSHHGDEYTSYGLEECLKLGAEVIGWRDKWHPPGQGPVVDGVKRHGIGMAMCDWHAWLGQGAAIVRINEDGTAHVSVGVTDIGTGAKSTMALIAAEVLGLALEDIKVVWGDTDLCPYSIGESGSRTTTFTGIAVKAAAEDAKRQLLQIASRLLDARPEDLEVEDRSIFVRQDRSRSVTIRQVASKMPDAIIGRGATKPELPPGKARASFAAHFVEVLVDEETGMVEVSRYVAVHDSGPVVNRLTAESQVQGGVIMGLGTALREELIIDRDQGLVQNPNLWTYRIPTQQDAPRIEVHFVETDDPYGPKSLGEVPIIPVAPALGNAIFNATGARLREIPMTPERVLSAIKASRSSK